MQIMNVIIIQPSYVALFPTNSNIILSAALPIDLLSVPYSYGRNFTPTPKRVISLLNI